MDYKKHTANFNNGLNQLSEDGFIFNENLGPPYLISLEGYRIVIQNQSALKKFHDAIELFYLECSEINNVVSYKTVKKYFENTLLILVRDKKKFDNKVFKKIIDDILILSSNKYKIFYEISGINLGSKNSVDFGEFSFYKPTSTHDYFNLESNKDNVIKRIIEDRDFSNVILVSISVNARDFEKAIELADNKVELLELIFNFFISDINHRYSIGVFNNWRFNPVLRIALLENGTLGASGNGHIVHDLNLDDIDFNSEEFGYNKVWEIFAKAEPNEMQNRIRNAIKWYGKAINDYDLNQTFIQLVFAIETILNYKETNEIITPSISYKISEALSFIISDNRDDRMNTFSKFKKLYGLRSGIVHGGKHEIKRNEVLGVMFFAKKLIATLLVSDSFSKFKTTKQLYEYIEELKFS